MATWNINDWDTVEDPKWEVTEDDTDDEFDDLQLARLGIELPECAKEISRPRHQEGVGRDFYQFMRLIDGIDLEPSIRAAMESVMEGGTMRFGDEPRGIDPVIAGFDSLDDDEDSETCAVCGHDSYRCSCDDYDPDYCYDHDCPRHSCGCDNHAQDWDNPCPYCGNEYEDCVCPVDDDPTR